MSDGHLRSFVERLLRLNEERKALTDDIKDVCAEAKATGFNAKALRTLVNELMADDSKRAAKGELDEIVDLYRAEYHRPSHVREAAE